MNKFSDVFCWKLHIFWLEILRNQKESDISRRLQETSENSFIYSRSIVLAAEWSSFMFLDVTFNALKRDFPISVCQLCAE